ncbi:hypothetical protein RHSIM_Rhsim08G0170100 [Rhododendron simsii]|uniref:Uncharacterized protein n=1 Tax=Rhododendron simsii TaxID=118357 RepID=A0A834GMT4_RHOSS|nr:hypothetical protein RHSIM_Rhsim08G0170100 [Rhododendron simsii]
MEMRIEGESIVSLLLSENWNSRPFGSGREVEARYEGMSGADKKSMNKLEERALEEAEAQMKGSGSTSGVTAAAGGSEAESDQGSFRFCYCSII